MTANLLDGERALSAWIATEISFAWIVRRQPWELEDYLIRRLDLRLNLEGMAEIGTTAARDEASLLSEPTSSTGTNTNKPVTVTKGLLVRAS